MKVLVISTNAAKFSAFKKKLKESNEVEEVFETGDLKTTLSWVRQGNVDTVVVDEELDNITGCAFLESLVKVNPMVNTALVSSLSGGDFHEATEGLGVLMPLSPEPSTEEAELLISKLSRVAGLMQPATK